MATYSTLLNFKSTNWHSPFLYLILSTCFLITSYRIYLLLNWCLCFTIIYYQFFYYINTISFFYSDECFPFLHHLLLSYERKNTNLLHVINILMPRKNTLLVRKDTYWNFKILLSSRLPHTNATIIAEITKYFLILTRTLSSNVFHYYHISLISHSLYM